MHDEFGPEKIIEVYDPKSGMRGFVVIDNTVLGPGKGGIRMTPSVTSEEVFRLARAMTWKNSLANLPFGGAKSGIVADPKNMSIEKKKEIVQAFSRALKIVSPDQYVAAPDISMAEKEVEWYVNANGSMKSATGKPKSLGGLPHELGSTGFGVYHSTLVAIPYAIPNAIPNAMPHAGLKENTYYADITFAVEGFGNVGSFAAKFLTEKGLKLVAVSDSSGVIYNPKGIKYSELFETKEKEGSISGYPDAKKIDSILEVDADILITAAIPDLILAGDIDSLKFKLIVQGSNIPMTEDVEELAKDKGILVVPDFVANAGGVISSYAEYEGIGEKEAFELIESKITKNTKTVLDLTKEKDILPRTAARKIAKKRIREKMQA